MAEQHQPQPHPYLQEPLLYISNLAQHVTDAELAQAFESCVPFRPRIIRDGSERSLMGTIEFKQLEKAEKALATLQGRSIAGLLSPSTIRLSPFPPDQATVLPSPFASPRVVKQLPPGFTDAQLYDLFRPFGPLASVRTQTLFGADTGILEYWREEDAKAAEENMHCAEVGDRNIAVQVYHPRRASGTGAGGSEFSPSAPAFVPSGSLFPQPAGPFVHGPGQMVQFAPLSGPGAGSHSGLIDPCNLFVKNLDEKIDSKTLFTHFNQFGQIVSARVMRDESGRSRGFGFVSFQTPDQAALAMHSMNGVVLGQKQIVVRLHEPKQLRQEKLAQRFAGGHNNHPRSRSGATSPTASDAGDSFSGWPSPRGGYQSLASPSSYSSGLTPDRARRSSGSYYNAALAGHLNMSLSLEDLSALSPVVRKEVLTGELQRRVKTMGEVPASDVDGIVDALAGLSLSELVVVIHDNAKFTEAVQTAQNALSNLSESRTGSNQERSKSPSPAASADSRLLDPNVLAATASAPDHPSTPVSLSTPLSTPPRTSSPAAAAQPGGGGASERERLGAAVARLEPEPMRAASITELLMSLSKRERAMCLFNVEVLRGKVADAKIVLDSDDADESSSPAAPVPMTPSRKTPVASSLDESPHTPALSSRGPSAAASPVAPVTPPSKSVSDMLGAPVTLDKLAQMPAAKVIEVVRSSATADALGLPKADPIIVKATDEFIDSLAAQTVPKQKQQVGDKLFRVVKNFGIKGAPKVTIALLDQEELRPLAHLMNSYPAVLKEKALLAQAAIAASK
ncbi:hypothetical protein EW145_g2962 [Phellinidium pouzarii]|uniref:RRM domain-containing protein n=1 Tax=Phellinidium pouzarii TaxID=167371 RepID=A0A4S4LAU8_9AGAM|nr:hypothetical protein EW145_g2962 [Phellinidium pouzarii]